MKLRTVGRLGVILSIILFCIGIGVYSFTQLSLVDKGERYTPCCFCSS